MIVVEVGILILVEEVFFSLCAKTFADGSYPAKDDLDFPCNTSLENGRQRVSTKAWERGALSLFALRDFPLPSK